MAMLFNDLERRATAIRRLNLRPPVPGGLPASERDPGEVSADAADLHRFFD